jgi:hypothetical protein
MRQLAVESGKLKGEGSSVRGVLLLVETPMTDLSTDA